MPPKPFQRQERRNFVVPGALSPLPRRSLKVYVQVQKDRPYFRRPEADSRWIEGIYGAKRREGFGESSPQ